MFHIDERIDYQRIQQFASQVSNLSKRLDTELAENYSGDQSDDFYFGLVAGFANSLSVFQNEDLSDKDKESLLGAIVAFISDRMARRGL